MKPLILCALLIGLANPAHALSCMRPDPVQDFLEADASDEVWIVVDGELSFDESRLPHPDPIMLNVSPPQTNIPARLAGKSLSGQGFERDFRADITLRVLCFGRWCGGAVNKARYLAFLKRESNGYVMIANPCGTRVYSDPQLAIKKTLTDCMRGAPCEPMPSR